MNLDRLTERGKGLERRRQLSRQEMNIVSLYKLLARRAINACSAACSLASATVGDLASP